MADDQDTGYPREPKTDKQHRIIDPGTGRPLRDRQRRSYGNAAFQGRTGKPHPRTKHLNARIASYEADRTKTTGRHKPGAL